LFYVVVASKVSWDFLVFSFQRNMRSNSWLMTPLKWPQMAMPVGFTLFALVLLFQVIQAIGKIKENRTPEGAVRENHGS
jgi:TRAP-type C4-dicarboxylate transport system permease small subunit